VLLWGDSHARSLAGEFGDALSNSGISGEVLVRQACAPTVDVLRLDDSGCFDHNVRVLEYIKQSEGINTVVLHARWSLNIIGERYKYEPGDPVAFRYFESKDLKDSSGIFENGFSNLVKELDDSGKAVVIITSIPEVGYDVPNREFISRIFKQELNEDWAPLRSEYLARTSAERVLFDRLSVRYKSVSVYETIESYCDEVLCNIEHDGKLVYRDDNHLTVYGASYLKNSLSKIVTSVHR